MILTVILAVSMIQVVAYLINNRLNFKLGRTIVLMIVLVGHFFLLPKLFYPKIDPDGVNCGMPVLGVTLAFWIFGGFSASLTHIFFRLTFRKTNRERPSDG